jgi:hypothetical protein
MTKPSTASDLAARAEEIAAAAPPVLPDGLRALRVPFPPEQVGKLPKPYRSDNPKGNCTECGKYHGLPAVHLDFVGHGAVTARLLDADPEWTWEPFALDANGLPALDKFGNLWIRLTVCGVTRIGVGDGASMKVLIGDALRNAAMRFGVALDLWGGSSEDEKSEDGETLQWNAGMVKAALVEILGDKAKARDAWAGGNGDSLTEFSRAVAQRLADEWEANQPPEDA